MFTYLHGLPWKILYEIENGRDVRDRVARQEEVFQVLMLENSLHKFMIILFLRMFSHLSILIFRVSKVVVAQPQPGGYHLLLKRTARHACVAGDGTANQAVSLYKLCFNILCLKCNNRKIQSFITVKGLFSISFIKAAAMTTVTPRLHATIRKYEY